MIWVWSWALKEAHIAMTRSGQICQILLFSASSLKLRSWDSQTEITCSEEHWSVCQWLWKALKSTVSAHIPLSYMECVPVYSSHTESLVACEAVKSKQPASHSEPASMALSVDLFNEPVRPSEPASMALSVDLFNEPVQPSEPASMASSKSTSSMSLFDSVSLLQWCTPQWACYNGVQFLTHLPSFYTHLQRYGAFAWLKLWVVAGACHNSWVPEYGMWAWPEPP